MPQMGQLPGVSCTTSGCIGQVYLTVWLPLAATSDVLQPVMAGIAAPNTSGISAIVIQVIFFIVVSHDYFEPENLPVLWGITHIGGKSVVPCPIRSQRRLRSGAGKIYETALDVGVDEFDANVVAHFKSLKSERKPAFGRRLE